MWGGVLPESGHRFYDHSGRGAEVARQGGIVGHNLPVSRSLKPSFKGLLDSETCRMAYALISARADLRFIASIIDPPEMFHINERKRCRPSDQQQTIQRFETANNT